MCLLQLALLTHSHSYYAVKACAVVLYELGVIIYLFGCSCLKSPSASLKGSGIVVSKLLAMLRKAQEM